MHNNLPEKPAIAGKGYKALRDATPALLSMAFSRSQEAQAIAPAALLARLGPLLHGGEYKSIAACLSAFPGVFFEQDQTLIGSSSTTGPATLELRKCADDRFVIALR
jgi:hypothetical protein